MINEQIIMKKKHTIKIVKPARNDGYRSTGCKGAKKLICKLYDSDNKRAGNSWWFRNFANVQRQIYNSLVFGDLGSGVCNLGIDDMIRFVDENMDADGLMHLEIFVKPESFKIIDWKNLIISGIGAVAEFSLINKKDFRFVCVIHSEDDVPHAHVIYQKPRIKTNIHLKSLLYKIETEFGEALEYMMNAL